MYRNCVNNIVLSFVVVIFAMGCTTSNPYIFKPNEFNRVSPDFNRTPKDRKTIKICYDKFSSKLSDVQKLAQEGCSIYGKIARFKERDFLHCPLMTPIGVTFNCLRP